VRQEVTAFAHEEKSAAWTTNGAIKIATKQLSFATDRTPQAEQRPELHTYRYTSFMPDNSFDVVSVVEMPEVLNAIQQARKEVQTRFDLKDSKSQMDLNEKDKKLVIQSIDDFKLKAVVEVLQQKLAKRKVPLKNFSYGPITPAAGSTARQEITIQSGIPVEKSKEIVKKIKDSKIKVQASIQGDFVRVSGKSRDLLQEVIQLLRGADFGLELQFTNYRTF
jgi:cyclic-di-GMP-binding protein